MQAGAVYIVSLIKGMYNTHKTQNTRNTVTHWIQQQVTEYVSFSIYITMCWVEEINSPL